MSGIARGATAVVRPGVSARSLWARIVRFASVHPLGTTLVVALTARVTFAVGSFALNHPSLAPDEMQYISLAKVVAHGGTPDQWAPGYGPKLYHDSRAFMLPLVELFRVAGASRLLGQLYVVAVGSAVAMATTALGLRFLARRFAFGAGFVVALMPSQVLFSSIVLREAHVWLGLLVVAFGAWWLASDDRATMARGVATAVVGLLALSLLRSQTMLAAAWALLLAVAFYGGTHGRSRASIALASALFVPWIAGYGLAGANLVSQFAPSLAQERATLGVGANSAFGGAVAPLDAAIDAKCSPALIASAHLACRSLSASARQIVASTEPDNSLSANLSHLPEGVVDVALRPFPGEHAGGRSTLLAGLESLVWYVLYGLGAVGVVAAWRRRPLRLGLLFPLLLVLTITGIGALTQGNLGTAFRHREQILWPLALCAAAGAQHLFERRRASRG